ncbi:ATP-binding protein, partial [Chloroflexota bacterium]
IALRQELPLETVKTEIKNLFKNGVIIPKNFQTLESPRFARSVAQLHDATKSILDIDTELYDSDSEGELFRLWDEFCEAEWFPDQTAKINKMERPRSRVIPAYRAIKDLPNVQPYEDIRDMLKIQERIAVASCSCRKGKAVVGTACEHSHDANCIQFNRAAEYVTARGAGHELNYDEALELIDEIEEDGLVHTWGNDRRMSVGVLCSCCLDCCMVWHAVDANEGDIGKSWAKSRFQAEVDQELCSGCQICVDRCMFDAIEMVKVPDSKKLKAIVNPEKCFGCGVCVLKCKPTSLHMKEVRPPEHIAKVPA